MTDPVIEPTTSAHIHGHDEGPPASSSVRLFVYGGIALILVFALVILPSRNFHVPKLSDQGKTTTGKVVKITDDHLEDSGIGEVRNQTIDVRVGNQDVSIQRTFATNDAGNVEVHPGDKVLVSQSQGPDGPSYYIADIVRTFPLWALTIAFVATVIVVGQWKGLRSLLGMITSLAIIIRFIIPAILTGYSPLWFSIWGALLILSTTLYLAHGVSLKTTVALLGTAIALLLTGALAVACISFFRLTGLANEDSSTLSIISQGRIDASGLLLGSIIIGGLGVLADVTVGQASAVFELHDVDNKMTAEELFRRGMNVGRDHAAATVNTLVLAYAGASLPLMIILATQSEAFSSLLNREFMATEIVRTLVASIGILAAVPITTFLAAIGVKTDPNKKRNKAPTTLDAPLDFTVHP